MSLANSSVTVHKLSLTHNGKRFSVTTEGLAASANELLVDFRSARSGSVSLKNLLSFSDTERVQVLLPFLAALPATVKFRSKEGEAHPDLLSAMLALIQPGQIAEQAGRAKAAVIEVIALRHRDESKPIACQMLEDRLKKCGLCKESAARIGKAVDEVVKRWTPAQEGRTVIQALPDAPVSESHLVPLGYQLSAKWVSRNGNVVIPAGLVIKARGRRVDQDGEHVTLSWHRDGRWQQRVVERETIANTRTIVELARYGLPVTSVNAKDVVQYLLAYEVDNFQHLEQMLVTNRLGWHQVGAKWVFAIGRKVLGDKSAAAALSFQPDDAGDRQLADTLRCNGRMEKWQQAVESIAPFPCVQLVLYAAFVPPLLRIFRAQNFTLSLSGRTSTGKTTSLQVAASAYGCPVPGDDRAFLGSWNSTDVAAERQVAELHDLPALLDDIKVLSHEKASSRVPGFCYSLSEGLGKGRGSVRGMARQTVNRSVSMISSEQPLRSYGRHGGAFARVLELSGAMFGAESEESAALVARLRDGISRNYGWAGRKFICFVLKKKNEWPAWRLRYLDRVTIEQKLAGNNAVRHRLASHLAAIAVAAELVHEAKILPFELNDSVAALRSKFGEQAEEADLGARALECVVAWAAAHRSEFVTDGERSNSTTASRRPTHGWAGRWDETGSSRRTTGGRREPVGYLGFTESTLHRILTEADFEPHATVADWRERGWLLMTKEKSVLRTKYKARVEGQTIGLIAIRRAVVIRVIGVSDA